MQVETPNIFVPEFNSTNDPSTMELLKFRKSIEMVKYMKQIKEEDKVNLMEQLQNDLP